MIDRPFPRGPRQYVIQNQQKNMSVHPEGTGSIFNQNYALEKFNSIKLKSCISPPSRVPST